MRHNAGPPINTHTFAYSVGGYQYTADLLALEQRETLTEKSVGQVGAMIRKSQPWSF